MIDDDYRRLERFEQLVRSFPTLRHVSAELFRPWDAVRFAQLFRSASGGEKDAALFVLSVWNPTTDWRKLAKLARDRSPTGGFFDVHRALGNWDFENCAAFLAWARDPWWP